MTSSTGGVNTWRELHLKRALHNELDTNPSHACSRSYYVAFVMRPFMDVFFQTWFRYEGT